MKNERNKSVMIIRNVLIENAAQPADIRIDNGCFREIRAGLIPGENEEVVDGENHLLLPPFIESHIHLDTCLTAGNPCWNESGTPFYPLGTGNVMDVVMLGLHVCQMLGYREIMKSYERVTTHAAKTLHLGSSYGIRVGNPADFIILDAPNFQEALNRHAAVLYSYRRGRKLAKTRPAVRALSF